MPRAEGWWRTTARRTGGKGRRIRFVRGGGLSREGLSDTSRDVAVAVSPSFRSSPLVALVLVTALPFSVVAAPASGTLHLDTGAKGAPVLIDGAPAGVAPLPGPWTLPEGPHTVELAPKGRPSVKAAFTIVAGKESRVELLPVDPNAGVEPDAATPGNVRVVYSGPGFSLATAGYVTAGVGVAAGALAVLFGLQANSKADDADKLDKSDPTLTRAGQLQLMDEADRAALLCNVAAGAGIVAGVAGLSMVLLASDGPLKGLSFAPTPSGAVFGGTF